MDVFSAATSVVFDIDHFDLMGANLRILPQIVLGIIRKITLFAIECIFNFLNSMGGF